MTNRGVGTVVRMFPRVLDKNWDESNRQAQFITAAEIPLWEIFNLIFVILVSTNKYHTRFLYALRLLEKKDSFHLNVFFPFVYVIALFKKRCEYPNIDRQISFPLQVVMILMFYFRISYIPCLGFE